MDLLSVMKAIIAAIITLKLNFLVSIILYPKYLM